MSLIFALPSIRALSAITGNQRGVVRDSCASAFVYIRTLILSALIIAIAGSVITLINLHDIDVGFIFDSIAYERYATTAALALIPNMSIWYMAVLTGGTIFMSGSESYMALNGTVSFSGVHMSIPPYYDLAMSWFGLPLLITGLVIAVTAVYQTLRDDDRYIHKGLTAAGISAVVVWVISICADIGFSVVVMRDRASFLMTSASFTNTLFCALMISAAVVVVYFARKSPDFDNIIKKVARPRIAYLLSLVAIILVGFTGRLA
jgi:hypothetical protein